MTDQKDIRFTVTIDEERILKADVQLTKQIWINTSENAINYSLDLSTIASSEVEKGITIYITLPIWEDSLI